MSSPRYKCTPSYISLCSCSVLAQNTCAKSFASSKNIRTTTLQFALLFVLSFRSNPSCLTQHIMHVYSSFALHRAFNVYCSHHVFDTTNINLCYHYTFTALTCISFFKTPCVLSYRTLTNMDSSEVLWFASYRCTCLFGTCKHTNQAVLSFQHTSVLHHHWFNIKMSNTYIIALFHKQSLYNHP